jgi:hypothetical protein
VRLGYYFGHTQPICLFLSCADNQVLWTLAPGQQTNQNLPVERDYEEGLRQMAYIDVARLPTAARSLERGSYNPDFPIPLSAKMALNPIVGAR